MSKPWNPFKTKTWYTDPLPAGIHHYQAPADDPRNYRMHLRLEEDGTGLLILNAATILHLNQTAAEYAYHMVYNVDPDTVARVVSSRYHVSPKQARQDYLDISDRILTLIETPDLDPVSFLDIERQAPLQKRITAPYRLDCALTYKLPQTEEADSAPVECVKQELFTIDWIAILDNAWQHGIPHIVFTGGEATLREDLVELVQHTEQNGQVSGLLTDGLLLAGDSLLRSLLQAGLDHLLIVLQPDLEESWQAVALALVEDIFLAVHLTLTPENASQAPVILKRLSEMGVYAVSLSATQPSLAESLANARNQVAYLGMELVWNLPVPYSDLNPVSLENKEVIQEGAGRAWLYVEPDGDVLPSQGEPRVLGNLLQDEWGKIWKA